MEDTEVHKSFMVRALDATPRPALAIMGTLLGFAICIVFVLNFGGLQAPVSRVINAHAVRIEHAATAVSDAAKSLAATAQRVEDLAEKLGEIQSSVQAIKKTQDEQAARVTAIENKLTEQNKNRSSVERSRQ